MLPCKTLPVISGLRKMSGYGQGQCATNQGLEPVPIKIARIKTLYLGYRAEFISLESRVTLHLEQGVKFQSTKS